MTFLRTNAGELARLTVQHVALVGAAVLLAAVVGLGLGILTYRRPAAAAAVLDATGVFLTIPSFALFGLLIPVLGLGWPPALVALVGYALLPIVRNTITGLRQVDPAVVETARGLGMTPGQVLRRVELPLAWPVVLAGLRVATLLLVGIAAIAAYVNGPGLGAYIFDGLARFGGANAVEYALAGTLGVVVVAVLLDGLLALLGRLTTSKGVA